MNRRSTSPTSRTTVRLRKKKVFGNTSDVFEYNDSENISNEEHFEPNENCISMVNNLIDFQVEIFSNLAEYMKQQENYSQEKSDSIPFNSIEVCVNRYVILSI